CKRRGTSAPVLAIGDGALGFWAALREVFPDTREQRCWFHVQANVLNALPKSAQPGAEAALAEIYHVEDREHALAAAKAFAADYGTKWPKAIAKIINNLDVLLEFYHYPAPLGVSQVIAYTCELDTVLPKTQRRSRRNRSNVAAALAATSRTNSTAAGDALCR
ncbi:MAG: transposase, partial [Pseudonocardiales bacterium]|nr:transposase [Pseudonocardiales bacterium]